VIWLVRHGETDWNRLGTVQGHQDAPRLTARGSRQAERAATLLADLPVEALYSSDLRRATSTAAVIADRLGRAAVIDDRLRERSLGVFEGSPVGALAPADTGLKDGRIVCPSARPPGGESLEDVYRRCRSFAASVASSVPTGDVVVVAHGGSLRMLGAALTGADVDGMRWEQVPNGSVRRVAVPVGAREVVPGAGAGHPDVTAEGEAP